MNDSNVTVYQPPVVTLPEMEIMAECVVASKLFGVKTKPEAMALMFLAQAKGRHPMTIVEEYDIIGGKPAMKARAMLAHHQETGGTWEWGTLSDTEVSAYSSSPFCPKPTYFMWNIERARKAGLAGKEMWGKYPQDMLAARVIREAVSKTNPAACGGFYTPEEVRDFVDLQDNSGTPSGKWAMPQETVAGADDYAPPKADATPADSNAPRSRTEPQKKLFFALLAQLAKWHPELGDKKTGSAACKAKMNTYLETDYTSSNELSTSEAARLIEAWQAEIKEHERLDAEKRDAPPEENTTTEGY